ncbi:MAG TPA: pyridoxamine 5'-phosphate oxidase family protein [Candidatus Dormibacteraeota bacterium]|nr:pyridoxamine 5'-phosphate oxidase family protein [Candidatus Dormibacteraeota bacterium]
MRHRDPLENVAQAECVRLLKSQHLGRIGIVGRDGQPLIFPVNYFFDEGVVVLRTDPGTKLELAPEARVSFEIDGWDAAAGQGWSVLVLGLAHDITDPPDAWAERMRRWPVRPVAPGSRQHWLGVWANQITGRRFYQEPRPAR